MCKRGLWDESDSQFGGRNTYETLEFMLEYGTRNLGNSLVFLNEWKLLINQLFQRIPVSSGQACKGKQVCWVVPVTGWELEPRPQENSLKGLVGTPYVHCEDSNSWSPPAISASRFDSANANRSGQGQLRSWNQVLSESEAGADYKHWVACSLSAVEGSHPWREISIECCLS